VAPLLPGPETFLVHVYLEPGPGFSANSVTTDTVLVDNPDDGSSMKRAEDG
jgi:hypothetical protein